MVLMVLMVLMEGILSGLCSGKYCLVGFPGSFPSVWQELIDLRGECVRQPAEDIFEIFERVYLQAAAGLDEAHQDRSGLSAIGGAHE